MQRLFLASHLVVGLALFFVTGCFKNKSSESTPVENKSTTAGEPTKKPNHTDHSGWWCDEHGVPEHLCSICLATVRADCKRKGDWCTKHERARSHCFLCEPALKEKFAAMHRAKLGTEPPPCDDN